MNSYKIIFILIMLSLLVNSCDSTKSMVVESNTLTECENCTIEHLRKLRFSKEEPDINLMGTFLMCCNKQCALNVEYSQASNYSIFIIIQDHPNIFMKAIVDKIDSIDISYIKSMLENPVSDDIDVNKTIESLKSSSDSSQYKLQLLESLMISSKK